MATIKAISISDRKGIRKENISATTLIPDFGLENDAHGGKWHRQVSFLAEESIETMRQKGLDVVAGNFAENITTEGLDLTSLEVGTHIQMGDCELVISQLGKICHTRCAIYHQAGDCVMPREGIFAVVLKGGTIEIGDSLATTGSISETTAIICSKKCEKEYGEKLAKSVNKRFSPPFVRFDTISTKEGGSFTEILKDLTQTQKITNIVVFDPSGSLGLHLMGKSRPDSSNIFYCRTLDELSSI